jgi:endoglycosylceramidase
LYVVLDMHQYGWARRFGGYGVPDWAVEAYPANETGMRQAVTDFWMNSELQGHFIQVWAKVAEYFADDPTIAGYYLLNEPWMYTSLAQRLNASSVNEFYLRTIEAIRTVDKNHIVFLEPANIYTTKLRVTQNIVWSPHFYPLSFEAKYQPENFTLLEQDFLEKYHTFMVDSGTPMWIGEFGAFMPDGSSRGVWTQDALTLFDRYQVGWTWWAYNGQYTTIPNQLP